MDINSFLETALWSTLGFDDDMLDVKFSIDQVSDEFKASCQDTMDKFIDKARPFFTDDELENSPIEHDLWLTMHDQGAGFWDGDYENGDELTKIAKEFKELEDQLRDDLYSKIEE